MAGARFLVSGRVQGVFYRASTREEALRLELTGHARNLPDGRVEVRAHGESAALEALERLLWQGPPAAKVTDVAKEADEGEAPEGFVTG